MTALLVPLRFIISQSKDNKCAHKGQRWWGVTVMELE